MKTLDIYNPFNAPVYHEETVGSTMEVSRFLALNGTAHGTVITADFQEAGRGRIRERRWEMERGNGLAFTILLRFNNAEDVAAVAAPEGQTPLESQGAVAGTIPAGLEGQTPLESQGAVAGTIPAGLTLRAGLAVALAIEDFAPSLAGKALIKWPNDILLPAVNDDESPALKAAGILAEAENGNVHIGIGVNLSRDRHLLHGKATSVCFAAGLEYNQGDRHRLLGKILSRLHDEIDAGRDKSSEWRGHIEARLFKRGEQICFAKGVADSGNLITGTLVGIGSEGELLVLPTDETETESFTAGELLFFR